VVEINYVAYLGNKLYNAPMPETCPYCTLPMAHHVKIQFINGEARCTVRGILSKGKPYQPWRTAKDSTGEDTQPS